MSETTMEPQIQRLVNQTWKKFQDVDASRRFMIAISGIPGSGKTTTAASVVHGLNKLHHKSYHDNFPNAPEGRDPSQPDIALIVPLDGYHLTRKQLSEMPDPEEASFRRGAAFTFDSQAYLKLVEKLRKPIEATTTTIHAPSFDHAVKDPVEKDIQIPPGARIIVVEGLYTAMSREGWRDAATLMDELWFVEVSLEVATERVAKRNFAAGLSPTYDDALSRTIKNDMRNAQEILSEKLPIDAVIESIDDEEWKSEEMKQMEDDEQYNEPQRRFRANRMDSLAELAEGGGGC